MVTIFSSAKTVCCDTRWASKSCWQQLAVTCSGWDWHHIYKVCAAVFIIYLSHKNIHIISSYYKLPKANCSMLKCFLVFCASLCQHVEHVQMQDLYHWIIMSQQKTDMVENISMYIKTTHEDIFAPTFHDTSPSICLHCIAVWCLV